MRVVCCNKYFFLNGGTERYLRNVMSQLENLGHEAVPFSVAYAGSWASPYSSYFLPPPDKPENIYLNQLSPSPKNVLTLAGRSIYSFEAKRCLSRLLDALGGADAAYVLNVYNFMSPSIIDTLKSRGIRVVMRLGDFNLVCANYKLTRDGKPCTLCVRGAYYHGLRHRCVHASLGASAVRVFGMYVQRLLGVYGKVDTFVAPSAFMRDRLVEGGIPAERVAVLHQPADTTLTKCADVPKTDSILFFGRVTDEKGLDILINAYQQSGVTADLHIVGRSYDGCADTLKAMVRPEFAGKIHFKDFTHLTELSGMIARARLCVVPSRYPDNSPQSIMESYVHATPVLGARIGGISEEITPGVTGDIFEAGDTAGLAAKLRTLMADPEGIARMGQEAMRFATTKRSFENHMQSLVPILQGTARNTP